MATKQELLKAIEKIENSEELTKEFRKKYATDFEMVKASINADFIKKSAANFIIKLAKGDTTKVLFRKFQDEIIALFPYEIADHKGHVMSYQHIGQHSSAAYNMVMDNSKPATPSEILPLYEELESIGYNLEIVKKRNYDKYLKEVYKLRGKK